MGLLRGRPVRPDLGQVMSPPREAQGACMIIGSQVINAAVRQQVTSAS